MPDIGCHENNQMNHPELQSPAPGSGAYPAGRKLIRIALILLVLAVFTAAVTLAEGGLQTGTEPAETDPFAFDGEYLSYAYPVDIYCNQTVYRAGEPVTVSADILGGTPPFSVEWYVSAFSERWNSFDEPANPLDVYMEAHPEFRTESEYVTGSRHIEFSFTPPVECGILEFSVYLTDAAGEHSDDYTPNGTNDIVTLYSAEEWSAAFPGAGIPEPDHFPFMAKTAADRLEAKQWCGDDYHTVALFPRQGSRVEVVGKEYDDEGRKWYAIRTDFYNTGFIRSDLLKKEEPENGGTEPMFVSEGLLSTRWFPVDVYTDRYDYRAGEPVTFTADILGGTPPFDISWYVSESIIRDWSPLDAYLETHPDYPTSASCTTDSRHLEFVFTPPVDSEEFGVYLGVTDANGIENYRWIEGGDREADLWISSQRETGAFELNANRLAAGIPFMTETIRDNVVIHGSWDKETTLPEQGTPVKVIGLRSDWPSSDLIYVVRYNLESFGWVSRGSVRDPGMPSDSPGTGDETDSDGDTGDGNASDGEYLTYAFPVDLYCREPIYQGGSPVTVCADILGGTPPFEISWIIDDEKGYIYDRTVITAYDRHVEYTFTPPADCGGIYIALYASDVNDERSDQEYSNDTADAIKIYSSSAWAESFPGVPEPSADPIPFMAETLSGSLSVRSWKGFDYPEISVIPEKGTEVEVIGSEIDDEGQKWYNVRLDFRTIGYVPADTLQLKKEIDVSAGELPFVREGELSRRWFRSVVIPDRKVYQVNEPITFRSEIVGGVPPFTVTWRIEESIQRATTPLDIYLESHPDYEYWDSFVTDSRQIEFVYTPPVLSEGFGVILDIRDGNGVRNYRDFSGGDRAWDCYIMSPDEAAE